MISRGGQGTALFRNSDLKSDSIPFDSEFEDRKFYPVSKLAFEVEPLQQPFRCGRGTQQVVNSAPKEPQPSAPITVTGGHAQSKYAPLDCDIPERSEPLGCGNDPKWTSLSYCWDLHGKDPSVRQRGHGDYLDLAQIGGGKSGPVRPIASNIMMARMRASSVRLLELFELRMWLDPQLSCRAGRDKHGMWLDQRQQDRELEAQRQQERSLERRQLAVQNKLSRRRRRRKNLMGTRRVLERRKRAQRRRDGRRPDGWLDVQQPGDYCYYYYYGVAMFGLAVFIWSPAAICSGFVLLSVAVVCAATVFMAGKVGVRAWAAATTGMGHKRRFTSQVNTTVQEQVREQVSQDDLHQHVIRVAENTKMSAFPTVMQQIQQSLYQCGLSDNMPPAQAQALAWKMTTDVDKDGKTSPAYAPEVHTQVLDTEAALWFAGHVGLSVAFGNANVQSVDWLLDFIPVYVLQTHKEGKQLDWIFMGSCYLWTLATIKSVPTAQQSCDQLVRRYARRNKRGLPQSMVGSWKLVLDNIDKKARRLRVTLEEIRIAHGQRWQFPQLPAMEPTYTTRADGAQAQSTSGGAGGDNGSGDNDDQQQQQQNQNDKDNNKDDDDAGDARKSGGGQSPTPAAAADGGQPKQCPACKDKKPYAKLLTGDNRVRYDWLVQRGHVPQVSQTGQGQIYVKTHKGCDLHDPGVKQEVCGRSRSASEVTCVEVTCLQLCNSPVLAQSNSSALRSPRGPSSPRRGMSSGRRSRRRSSPHKVCTATLQRLPLSARRQL